MYLIANRESVPSWCPSIQLFLFGSPWCDFYHRTAYLIIVDIKKKKSIKQDIEDPVLIYLTTYTKYLAFREIVKLLALLFNRLALPMKKKNVLVKC